MHPVVPATLFGANIVFRRWEHAGAREAETSVV